MAKKRWMFVWEGLAFMVVALLTAFAGYVPLALLCCSVGVILFIIGIVGVLRFKGEKEEVEEEEVEEDEQMPLEGFNRNKFRKETMEKFYDEFQL